MSSRVDVVVVAFGAEPHLSNCLESLLASVGVDLRVVLVDNGCTRSDLTELAESDRISLVRSTHNLGFAGGCNLGATIANGEYLAFVNSDARVDPAAIHQLVVGLGHDVGLTTACILLADQPETVNAAGNPIHFLGMSWAGGLGDSLQEHLEGRDVASVSGAGLALRRDLWDLVGGFEARYFMYFEDVDLSVRVWQQGLRVRYVPSARIWHSYEFSRNKSKWFFLERNRLLVMLTTYQLRTLLLMAPALLFFEVALLVAACVDGRLRQKLNGYWWLLRHGGEVFSRRGVVQRQRVVGDGVLAPLLTGRVDSPVAVRPALSLVNIVLSRYWSLIQPIMARACTARRRLTAPGLAPVTSRSVQVLPRVALAEALQHAD